MGLAGPHWPAGFDEGMRDPLTAHIVRLIAQHVRRHAAQHAVARAVAGLRCREPELEACNPPPMPPRAPAPAQAPRRVLDFKSRAAGEREDD